MLDLDHDALPIINVGQVRRSNTYLDTSIPVEQILGSATTRERPQ